jgi:peptide/nickel transport system substrate-binding protein
MLSLISFGRVVSTVTGGAVALWLIAGGAAVAADMNMEIRAGFFGLPPGLGNPYAGSGPPGGYTYPAIFDTLTQVDLQGETQPYLATSWEVQADRTTWHFKLRPGVTFSNGEPFNAAAVVATLNWLVGNDAGKGTPVGKEVKSVASARAINDLTVEIITVKPIPTLPKQIAGAWIVAPKAWVDLGLEGFSANPVGSGPFKVTDFAGDRADLVAFEGSWRAPKAGRLTIFSLPDNAARAAALVSGQLHFATDLSPDATAQVEAAGGRIDTEAAPRIMGVSLISTDDSPLQHKAVRQAMNYSVNKDSIVQNLLRGAAVPASQGATHNTFGFNPNVKPYPYDPDKARRLLAEAGFPNGFKMVMEVMVGSFAADREIYTQVAAEFGQIGIEVDLRQIVFADWLKKFLGKRDDGRISFAGNAFNMGYQVSPDLDGIRAYQWASCRKEPAYYCNEDEMPLIEAAEQEFDVDKRRTMLQELAAIHADNAPILFIAEMRDFIGVAPSLKNFKNVNRVFTYSVMVVE